MKFEIQEHPNHNVCSFKYEKMIFGAEFLDIYPPPNDDLLNRLYNIDTSKIKKFFKCKDIIAIHKFEDASWGNYVESALHILNEYDFIENKTIIDDENKHSIENQIQKVIDQFIQPYISNHGGYIQLQKFEDGLVYISMHGACDGCPSAIDTLYNGVENILKFKIKEIKAIKLI